MAEDDLNEASKEAETVEAETQAADTPAPAKKKAVRKKIAKKSTPAKKKVVAKKKAAPKKKAARKRSITPKKSAVVATTAAEIADASTPAEVVTPSDNGVTPQSDQPTSPTSQQDNQAPDKSPETVDTTAAQTSESIADEKGTPQRNENVQKRLEEMGLMPSDSTEEQTPPPANKAGAGLGFWQKSFILVILIVAGLFYIRNIANNGDPESDGIAENQPGTTKIGTAISDTKTEPVSPTLTAESNQVAVVDAGEISQKGADSETDLASAEKPVETADQSASDTSVTTDDKTKLDHASDTVAEIAKGPVAVETAVNVEETHTAQTLAAPEATQLTTETANETASNQSNSTGSEAVVAESSDSKDSDVDQAATAITSAVSPSLVTTTDSANTAGSAVTDPKTAEKDLAKKAPITAPIVPYGRSQYSMPGRQPQINPGRQGIINQYNSRQPMLSNRDRSMQYRNRYGYLPPASTPYAKPNKEGNSTGNQSQAKAPQLPANQYPRRSGVPVYPWNFNQRTMPYYWPYPPRPPVYGPAVRYPYQYPQTPPAVPVR